MADQEIRELTAETALTAAAQFVVQESTDRATRAAFSLMGGMAVTTGSDADTTMAVGTLYRVDMSAWATSVRTYSLPTTAAVGERIGVYITAGNATHELAIRTTAASNDTINGTDYDSADWSKLFITGELVIFECVVANTDWVVLVDGRIPCSYKCNPRTAVTTNSAATWTDIDLASANEHYDVGDIGALASDQAIIRRDGKYLVSISGRPNAAVTDQAWFGVGWELNSSGTITEQNTREFPDTSQTYYTTVNSNYEFSDGDTINPRFRSEEANKGFDAQTAVDQLTWFAVVEIVSK